MQKTTKQKIIFLSLATAALVLLRLAFNGNMAFNFFPIAALAVFSGALLKTNRSLGLFFPLVVLLLSDLCLELMNPGYGFYGWDQIFNYGALVFITLIGVGMKPTKGLSVLGYIKYWRVCQRNARLFNRCIF